MKFRIVLFLLIIFSACKRQALEMDKMPDKDFILFISGNQNNTKGLARIDSILQSDNTFSIHKMGLLYHDKAEYLVGLNKLDIAILNFEKSLTLFEKESDKKYIAIVNNGLGRTNTTLKNHEKAIEQLKIAITIFKEIDDKPNELTALDGMAYLEFSRQNYNKAFDIIKKLLDLNLEMKDSISVVKNYNNLGFMAELLYDKPKAVAYYEKAVSLNRKMKNINSISLRNLGGYYLSVKEPEKASYLYIEALEVENNRGDLLVQKEIYTMLLDSVSDNKLINIAKYRIKKDSVISLLAKTESEEKLKLVEDQYKLIAREKELKQANSINIKNKIIFGVISGLLLFLGLFLNQRNKNSKLKLKQDKLVLEQKILRSQMNPHFIFNALGAIQNTLLDNDPLKSASALSKFSKLIRKNFEFINKTEISLEEDIEALTNYIETQKLRFEDEFDYRINIQEGMNISSLKIPPMLLQPFVENAIEHGLKPLDTKGFLEINISEGGDFIHFEISDNGVGYSDKKENTSREHATDIFLNRLELRKFGEEKLFSISNKKNSQGTVVNIFLKLSYA